MLPTPDPVLRDFFLDRVKRVECPTIIDVGASIGSFTVLDLPCTVHAFEPNPDAFDLLEANADGRAILHECAVGDYDGTALLSVTGNHEISTVGKPRRVEKEWQQVRVRMVRLDDLDFGKVDFIKIDTEGNELAVLKGAEKLIARDHPELLVEYTSLNTRQCGYEREEIVRLLKSWGYNRFKEVGREDLWAMVDESCPKSQYKYLATGTGGCGTLSLTKAFHYAGYNAVHEGPFGWSGVYPDIDAFWPEVEMSASWMAAHHLSRFTKEHPDVIIIHLVREPFKVVSSIHDAGMIHAPHLGGYVLFAHNALQSLHDYATGWDKTAHFVIEWNKRIEPYADLRWKIEDGIPGLMAHLGIEWDESLDQKWHASNKVHPRLERGMIAGELWDGLEKLRERYGY